MDVEFTDYALRRMRQRDVLEEEVRAVLESPPSSHRFRREDSRYEVRGRANAKILLVVYRREPELQIVLNVMWEK